ncbi:MAG: formylglycine-generating enzyme family protein [Planctomycetota bacterium]|nr:formylglycine-generating enzyme family protein [Planctomycetota bacterium]
MFWPMDENHWARRSLLDPENIAAKQKALLARARIEGRGVFVDLLSDREVWACLSPGIQDLAIQEIRQRLGSQFEYIDTCIYKCGQHSHRIASFQHGRSSLIFHLIPGGEVRLSFEDALEQVEMPATFEVKPFLMARFPVTQAQWVAQGYYNSSHFEDPDRPMESVSWEDCKDWLEFVGDGLRLPFEEEWEFANRAGSTDKFFWGGSIDGQYCWYYRNCRAGLASSLMRTQKLEEHWQSRAWNAFGLIDTLGNVQEWIEDPGVAIPIKSDGTPFHELTEDQSFCRGGDFGSYARYCRSASRSSYIKDMSVSRIGFRVARSL